MNKVLENLAAVLIFFHPDQECKKNALHFKKLIKDLYIYDNSKNNRGVAALYNKALKKAHAENKKWLMILDQDSFLDKEEFEKYINCIEAEKEKDVIIFAPSLKRAKKNCEFALNDIVISSAMVVDVVKSMKIGGFSEELFIDEVDHEFCLKALNAGYKIKKFENILLKHKLGNKKKFLFINFNCYRFERYYYMIRNFLWLNTKYKHKFLIMRKKYLLFFFIKSLIFCKNKLRIIKMLIKGYYDFKNNLMGKRVEIS